MIVGLIPQRFHVAFGENKAEVHVDGLIFVPELLQMTGCCIYGLLSDIQKVLVSYCHLFAFSQLVSLPVLLLMSFTAVGHSFTL